MKKFITIAVTLIVLASLVCMMPISAADVKLEAKAGKATVDGVIADGEYGAGYTLDAAVGGNWANLPVLAGVYSYQFAWDDTGLYVAVSYDQAALTGSPLVQFGLAPIDQASMPANKQVLFFTLRYVNGAPTIQHHHHETNLAGKDASLTDLVDIAAKVNGTKVVIEAKLPNAAFQIKGVCDNVKLDKGTYSFSTFVVETDASGAPSGTGTSAVSLGDWNAANIKLNTIELKAGTTETGDFGIIALAFVALSSLAAKKRKA